jgi:hypothetical protein
MTIGLIALDRAFRKGPSHQRAFNTIGSHIFPLCLLSAGLIQRCLEAHDRFHGRLGLLGFHA